MVTLFVKRGDDCVPNPSSGAYLDAPAYYFFKLAYF